MALSRRRRVAVISLLLYWPAIFVLTHIPLASIPDWMDQIKLSDKILHSLAYLVLVFLLWFAINPNRKVNWHKATVWWILFVVVWYGVLDEWLQAYVGRHADVTDFFADLVGTLTGLVLLSIFSFWSVSLVITAAVIFVLTNFMRSNLAEQLPMVNAAFHFLGYGFLSLLWTRYMYHLLPLRAPEGKWLIGALVPPMVFLLSVKLFCVAAGGGFRLQDVLISTVGIAAVVAVVLLTALFRRGLKQESGA